jgi:hypothetical protein
VLDLIKRAVRESSSRALIDASASESQAFLDLFLSGDSSAKDGGRGRLFEGLGNGDTS